MVLQRRSKYLLLIAIVFGSPKIDHNNSPSAARATKWIQTFQSKAIKKHNHKTTSKRGLHHRFAARSLDFCFQGNFIYQRRLISKHIHKIIPLKNTEKRKYYKCVLVHNLQKIWKTQRQNKLLICINSNGSSGQMIMMSEKLMQLWNVPEKLMETLPMLHRN